MTHIELDGGKYTVVHENGAGLHALRYGGPWRDLCGDGLVLAMAQEIEQLHGDITILAEERDNAGRNSSTFENRMGDLQVKNGKLHDQLSEVTAALKSLLRSLCHHEGEDAVGRVKGTWSADVEQAARDILGASQPMAEKRPSLPRIAGIGRDSRLPQVVLLYLGREPTDQDVSAIQSALRGD